MNGPSATRPTGATIHHLTPNPLRPDDRAKGLAAEAAAWAKHAHAAGGLAPDAVTAKALDALALSLTAGLHRLAIPTKLVGVKMRRDAVLALAASGAAPGTPLALSGEGELVAVSWSGRPLGFLQSKHGPWARVLVAHGLSAGVLAVTGLDDPKKTAGVNVALVGVGAALDRFHGVTAPAAGDGASGPPPSDDVRLYRDGRGVARTNIAPLVRHSATGIEWGYRGDGPADLALSVLARFAPAAEAERLYRAFERDAIARVPYTGGVLRAERVRAWLDRHAEAPAA